MGQGDGQKNIPKETIQKGLEIKEIMTCTELEFKRNVVKGEKFIRAEEKPEYCLA